jgi:hypothetical protein
MTFHRRHLIPTGLCLLLLLGLGGCVHRKSDAPLPMQTRITEGGLKLFEVIFPVPVDTLAMPNSSGRTPKQQKALSSKHMQKMLDEVMEQSGYCREGYVVLGRYAGETTRRMRGECRDRATDQDRQRFPDTIERW